MCRARDQTQRPVCSTPLTSRASTREQRPMALKIPGARPGGDPGRIDQGDVNSIAATQQSPLYSPCTKRTHSYTFTSQIRGHAPGYGS